MYTCKCGKQFEKQSSLNSHARFCSLYVKKKLSSKYKKEEHLYECECKKQFEFPQSLNAHFSHCSIHRKGKPETRSWISEGVMCGWKKFSENDIANIKKKSGKTLSENIKNGKIIPSFLGKQHTKEYKEKMSSLNSGRNNGYVKTKYYEVFCPFENKNVKVQGTWELKYATFLNDNKLNWIRSKSINLKYKLFNSDYWHTYYPDFYLPDTNEYIEIKGYWWKSNDGRIDDKRKMQMVKKYNPDKKITIITKI